MPTSKKRPQENISKTNENKLGFFRIKPITSLLCSDEQFQFVIELGKKIKHLLPANSEAVLEAENAKIAYQGKINMMKEIADNADMDSTEKESLIYSTGLEAKELVEVIDEFNKAKKDISNDRQKIKSALSNASKACNYWRKIDVMKYGEWLIIEMVGKRLLEKIDYTEKQGGERNSVNKGIIDVGDTQSRATSKETEIGRIDPELASAIDVDAILPPAKKAKADRKVLTLQNDTKYRYKEYAPITYADFKTQMNGGKQGKRESLHGHSFEWVDGCVKCTLCNIRFRQTRSMHKHIENKIHLKKIEQKKKGILTLQQRSLRHEDSQLKGMTVPIEEKEYRCGSLIAAANGNAPLTCIKYFADWANPYAKMTVCNEKDLLRSYVSMVLTTITDDIKNVIKKGSFIEYSVTFDGTPSFAEAEAVIIRVVTKDYHILELLVKCNLFKSKLNSVQLANHIVKTITQRLDKELKDWIAAQQDRASTNKGALKHIEVNFPNIKFSKNYCCSHTISNGGKK